MYYPKDGLGLKLMVSTCCGYPFGVGIKRPHRLPHYGRRAILEYQSVLLKEI